MHLSESHLRLHVCQSYMPPARFKSFIVQHGTRCVKQRYRRGVDENWQYRNSNDAVVHSARNRILRIIRRGQGRSSIRGPNLQRRRRNLRNSTGTIQNSISYSKPRSLYFLYRPPPKYRTVDDHPQIIDYHAKPLAPVLHQQLDAPIEDAFEMGLLQKFESIRSELKATVGRSIEETIIHKQVDSSIRRAARRTLE